MLNLTKGKWDNLEGRVVSYSKITNPDFLKNFHALFSIYTTTDATDFMEKMNLDEEGKANLKKCEKESKNEAERLSKKGIKFIPVYTGPVRFEEEKEIIIGNHDVIFTGNWDRPENCIESLEMGARLYIMRYSEQFLKKQGFDGDKKSKPVPAENESYTSHYGKSIKGILLNDYLNPIMDAKNNGDSERANILGLRMAHFIEGSSFVVDGLEVMALAKSAKGKKDYDLISTLLNKIDAIHLEKYEDAARYRDAVVSAKSH